MSYVWLYWKQEARAGAMNFPTESSDSSDKESGGYGLCRSEKALDIIDHQILCRKLESYGILRRELA